MRKAQFLVSALLLILPVAACAPTATPAPTPQAPAPRAVAPAPAAASTVRPAWEAEWDKTVEAAGKEGTVVVWGAVTEWRKVFTEGFGKKYGLRVEFMVTGRAAEQGAKLAAERRAGLYTLDVHLAGPSTALGVMKPAGVYDPMEPVLMLPEVVDPKLWQGGRLPFIDRDHTILAFLRAVQPDIAVNTNLVKPEEINSYSDLLNPKWKGKIIMEDPTQPGSGARIGIIAEPFMGGFDYLRQLAKNEPIISRDKRVPVEWVARGKVAITVIPSPRVLTEFMKIGAPIRVVWPKEGSSTQATGGGTATRVNKWPHPSAGTLFINWLLSKEGQTVAGKAAGYPSARADVTTDFVDPIFVPDPKIKYYDSDTEEYALKQAEDIKKLKEIFGSLLPK